MNKLAAAFAADFNGEIDPAHNLVKFKSVRVKTLEQIFFMDYYGGEEK